MPILPFVCDDEENIEAVVRKTKESEGQYVLAGGLTLEKGCKKPFFNVLEGYDSNLVSKYENIFDDQKRLKEHTAKAHQLVQKYCDKYGLKSYIPRPVNFYPQELQTNKKIAEKFYLKARELQVSDQNNYKEWAYRKAAWSLDELEENTKKIFHEKGTDGLMEIDGIGKSLSKQIKNLLKR